ncbi:MAG: hypothetical protein HXX19_10635 [Rhodoferax sp.]|nr:hypothetical protein [Rhodoferax sp.]
MTGTPELKGFATLQARAAIQLVELHRIEGDNGRLLYVASKWAETRRFESLQAVADWLDELTTVGGAA